MFDNLFSPRARMLRVFVVLTATLFLLSMWMALPAVAQVAPAPDPSAPVADFNVLHVIQLVTTHSWLPLAILVDLYLRHMLSDRSEFPLDVSPTWLPTVTAATGLLFTVLVTKQAGGTWSIALLGGMTMAVAGGFFDGLVVGIFGNDPTRVPKIVRVFLMLSKDVVGGGGSGSASDQKKNPLEREASKLTPTSKLGILGAAAFSLLMSACQPGGGGIQPQAVTDVNTGLTLAACMWGIYSRDESTTPPAQWQTVAIDMGTACGADVGNVVTLFGGTSNLGVAALSNASAIHTAAVAFKKAR